MKRVVGLPEGTMIKDMTHHVVPGRGEERTPSPTVAKEGVAIAATRAGWPVTPPVVRGSDKQTHADLAPVSKYRRM